MMEKGWICKGIDFDKDAIANAQSKGLDVSHGDLFSKEYEKETFDAIIMNHVIEHVTLPIEIITECHRILKKGGVLVMITPNSDSRGHLRYKRHWRGLEVPTHLHIFTTRSLALAAHTAGFKKIKNFSSLQGVQYIKNSSAAMERNGTFDVTEKNSTYQKVLKHFSFFIAGWLHLIFPKKDDAAVVVCTK